MVKIFQKILIEQAEKIVNADKGALQDYTLDQIREIIRGIYTLEKLRRLKPRSELWNWLLTFDYMMRSDCHDSTMYGVCNLEWSNSSVCLIVSCYDYHHWESLPSVVEFKSYSLQKRGWDAIDNTCRYMSTS